MSALGTQLHVRREDGFDVERMQPVLAVDRVWVKPRAGGLWTSSYSSECGSAWVQWCIEERVVADCAEGAGSWPECWLLEPHADARICEIDSFDDLRRPCLCYGRPQDDSPHASTYLDWSLLAEHFDAVHLTEEGEWATRLSAPYDLYGWDCESTLWFRAAFDATPLGARTWRIAAEEMAA